MQVAVFDPALAVIVAVPLALAVIFPPETVATEELLVLQVTLGSALDGLTVAVRVSVPPILRVVLVLLRVTLVTSAYLTVTLQVALFFPSADLAVMVAVPGATAVTFPPDTVATDELLVLQVTLGLALAGETVAVRVEEFPLINVSEEELRESPVASAYLTVTEQVAVFPLEDFAVMVAVPGAIPVIFPPETVATDELLVLQVTLDPTSEGETLAVIVVEFPLIRVRELWLRVTVVALYRAVSYSDCAVSSAVFAEAISEVSLDR